MRRLALLTAILCLALSTRADDTARPWTFWYWMYGAVTEAGIHADLQAMKDVGLGGCYLMPIRGTAEAPANLPPLGAAPAQQLTPRFWQLVDYALAQADSLGLKMGIHICDGFALAGGPWITPEESMQKIVWSDTIVRADQLQGAILPLPPAHDGYYEDIAAFALPVAPRPLSGPSSIASHPSPATFSFASAAHSPQLTLSPTMTLTDKGAFTATEAAWVQYDFAQPRTFRNIEIAANGTNLQGQRVAVEVSDDGTTFRQVRQLVPPRQGWQNYDYNTTFTYATFVRMDWLRKVGYDHVPANYAEQVDAINKMIAAGLTKNPIGAGIPTSAYITNFGFRDFPVSDEGEKEWAMHSSLGTPGFPWYPTERLLKRANAEYHMGWYSEEFDLDKNSSGMATDQTQTDFINGLF